MRTVLDRIWIHAPPARVWDVLGDYGAVAAWHPYVAAVEVESANERGLGAVRHCDFRDGLAIKERATSWIEGEELAIEIFGSGTPLDGSVAVFRVREAEGGSVLDFSMSIPPAIEAAAATAVEAEIVERAHALLKSLKHYVERGTRLPMEVPA